MKISDACNHKKSLSFEIFPPKKDSELKNIDATLDVLCELQPDFISVTFGAGGSLNCNRTIELAKKIKHASDLISYLKPKGDFCFLGACYPECHPESANKIEEIRHLKEKVNAGAEVLLSQLFFDNTQFYRFVEDCRIADINVPIVPGIMPVINAAQIKRMITMCGASFPERFQKIIHKFEDNKAALFDAGMSYALSQIIDLLANDTDGIHLYTMNNPVVARRICEGIQHII